MAFKVQVGPSQIAIHQGMTVLVTDEDGAINWPSDKGLYLMDTRLISAWSVWANGESWDLLTGGPVRHDTARIYLTNRAFETETGPIPRRTLSFVLARHINRGMRDDLEITNHGRVPVSFNLEILIRSDFSDVFDVKARRNIRRGHIESSWLDGSVLSTTYQNRDFLRAVSIRIDHDGADSVYANGRISFALRIAAGESWHGHLFYDFTAGTERFEAPLSGPTDDDWRDQVLKIHTSNEDVYRMYRQAVDDMGSLRLPIERNHGRVVVPAAGLPWFMAPFGRDSLIASLQCMMVYPEFARGALDVLGHFQATEHDAFRDAEPGKIMHELRYGELAHFRLIRHTPYYGTADATPLYLIVLHAAWKATGDRSLLETYLPNAEAALHWIDAEGDRDGDGFQEFHKRTEDGYENMSWKDSGDSMTWPDGTLVRGPKAVCELQGYVHDAWCRMAEVFEELNKPDRAKEMRAKAARLFTRFNDVFWDEETQFYAYLLDGEKRPVPTVTSDAGHLLWSGIVPPERAAMVVNRLMAPDMDSGWGIRTLSREHAAYNPFSYQNGAVWPHDNSLIALGMKRYGFHKEAAHLALCVSEAAGFFQLHQLPELYAGIDRGASPFPVQYLGANVPQAWAAASVFAFLQALLGVEQDAPNNRLWVEPALPAWLPDITLADIPLGSEKFTIRFTRGSDDTTFEVLAGDPAKVHRRRFMNGPDRL